MDADESQTLMFGEAGDCSIAYAVQAKPFDPIEIKSSLEALINSPKDSPQPAYPITGAWLEFTGVVRADSVNGQIVQSIELEHYSGMTESAMKGLLSKAAARFDCLGLVIVHRVGELKIAEPIVYVAAFTEHRQSGFDAVQFVMDYLKNDIPIWKKEIFQNDERWVEQKSRDKSAINNWNE